MKKSAVSWLYLWGVEHQSGFFCHVILWVECLFKQSISPQELTQCETVTNHRHAVFLSRIPGYPKHNRSEQGTFLGDPHSSGEANEIRVVIETDITALGI